MTVRIIVILASALAILLLAGVLSLRLNYESKVIPFHLSFKAQIDERIDIDEIEKVMRQFAETRQLELYELELFEKDRDGTGFLQGGVAMLLFVGLKFNDKVIVTVANRVVVTATNAGTAEWLTVNATDLGDLPLPELERLTYDVLSELGELGIEFHPTGLGLKSRPNEENDL